MHVRFWEGSRGRRGVMLPDSSQQAPSPTEPLLSMKVPPRRRHSTVTATRASGDFWLQWRNSFVDHFGSSVDFRSFTKYFY